MKKHNRFRSAQLIPLSFLGAIFFGTILLWLPFSAACGKHTDFLTALFTATTSVCVTGLVVVDTYAHWSLFGKAVILFLIQIGGLGIITVTSLIMVSLRKKYSLRRAVIIHDSFNLNSIGGMLQFLKKVFKGTFIAESLGALLYTIAFIPRYGLIRGVWYSLFTAVSAFCNAGIDILGPNSLMDYHSDILVMTTTMLLIIMGGLGYVVWFDCLKGLKEGIIKRHPYTRFIRNLGEHSKLVLTLTFILIGLGTVSIYILECHNPDTLGALSLKDKILNSLFQSVTFRTAGFAAIDQSALRDSSCMIGVILMFIGGSPVGTAGGVKTVTFFVVIANTYAFIKARNETNVFHHRISEQMIRKASAITFISFIVTFLMVILLLTSNHISLTDGMFEVFSATATVGLSRGLTPLLNTAGRWIIIICMYLGRIGPISMALFFSSSWSEQNSIRLSKGNFFVG
ncbi:MAG: potassium transporter TrkH [Blautia sp.]|nr:potassium transporter TrkH [Blautia sp.]